MPPPDQRVVSVIVPRGNDRDVLAAETFFGALRYPERLAFEIAARGDARSLQIRGAPEVVERAMALLRNAYPQAEFADLPERDELAHALAPVQRAYELRLRDGAHLPIRTHVSREGRAGLDDLRQAGDPMIGVLAAMDDLREGEHCLVQFVLEPAPDDWGKFWRGMASDVGERAKTRPQGIGLVVLAVLGVTLVGIGMLWLLLALMQGGNPTLVGLGALACLTGVGMIVVRFRLPSPPDPALIRQKINLAAFRVWPRVFVGANSAPAAQARARRLLGAFNAYNLAGGNGFRAHALADDVQPASLDLAADPNLVRLPLVGPTRAPWRPLPILNVAELAVLWHLPNAESGFQGLRATTSRKLAPQPQAVTDGAWLGWADVQGRRVQARLNRAQLRGNVGLIAKTQSGKSNLMAILASDVIANEPDTAVIVIDPHRDLARLVIANVPDARRRDAVFWSLADLDRPFGLNLLEPQAGGDGALLRPEKIVDNVIVAFREIWKDNWGPRMEDYLRWPLLTLTMANEMLAADVGFARWLTEARIAFANSKVRRDGLGYFVPAALDAAQIAMIDDVVARFGALAVPRRPSAEARHAALASALRDYAKLARLARAGDAPAREAWLARLKLAHTALFANATGRRADTGASAREYRDGSGVHPLPYTLLDVQPMQFSRAFRRDVLRSLPMDACWRIHRWWEEYDTYSAGHPRQLIEMITPVRTKLRQFDASDVAARIFGQPASTLDLARVIERGGVLAVDLAAGVVGQDVASLIGATVLNTVASLLFAQAARAERRQVLIVVDEFQSIAGADYATMLGELAKYGARVMLGTQSLGVLAAANPALKAAWLDNTSTLFVFRCGGEDARVMADELAIGAADALTVEPADIVGLPDHTCYVRSRDGAGSMQVFRLSTRKMDDGAPHALERIRDRSRREHGRDKDEVDDILRQAAVYHGAFDVFAPGAAGKATPRPVAGDGDAETPAARDVPLPGSWLAAPGSRGR